MRRSTLRTPLDDEPTSRARPRPLLNEYRPEVAEPRDDARDARRWRALMASERIAVHGTLRAAYQSDNIPGSRYMSIELWSHSKYPNSRLSRDFLRQYADFIVAVQDGTISAPTE